MNLFIVPPFGHRHVCKLFVYMFYLESLSIYRGVVRLNWGNDHSWQKTFFFKFYTEKSVILIVTLCIEIGFVSEFIAIIITSMDIKLLVLPALQCYQTLLSFFLSMSIERLQYGLMNQTIDEPEYLIIYVLSLKEKEKIISLLYTLLLVLIYMRIP